MAELQRPSFVVPSTLTPHDLMSGKVSQLLNLILHFIAQQDQRVAADAEQKYLAKNARLKANDLYIMEGAVSLDKATKPTAGQVLYALDGMYAAWGDAGAPAPTDPGTGPSVGAPHAILSAEHTDALAAAVSRGSLIAGNATPAWAELVAPGSQSVLVNDTTDVLYRTIPTRQVWLHVNDWVDAGATTATQTVRGTEPDSYRAWALGATDTVTLEHLFVVPADWRTGLITVFAHWTTDGAGATNWVPVFETLAVADGASMVAAGTSTAPAATSANFAADLRQRTSLISFAVNAGEIHRLVVGRVPTVGGDTFLGTIHLMAVELLYTPVY